MTNLMTEKRSQAKHLCNFAQPLSRQVNGVVEWTHPIAGAYPVVGRNKISYARE